MCSLTRAASPLLIAVFLGGGTFAQTDSDGSGEAAQQTSPRRRERAGQPRKPLRRITNEQRRFALDFADQHHPELAELLREKQQRQPAAYRKAVAGLYATASKLEELRKLKKEAYDEELAFWMLESRIRLLATKLAGTTDGQLEAELERLVRRRFKMILGQMEAKKRRLEERLASENKAIEVFSADYEYNVEQELIRLKSEAARLKSASSADEQEEESSR